VFSAQGPPLGTKHTLVTCAMQQGSQALPGIRLGTRTCKSLPNSL
jgi:hypothetical protein